MLCLQIAGLVANSRHPDETPNSAASHLGVNCLPRTVYPVTNGKSSSGHMWESQVLLVDGQVVFLRVLRFRPPLMNDRPDISEIFLKGT